MKQLPITVIILAHQDNQKLRNAIRSVSWAEEVLVIWSPTELPPKWLELDPIKVVKVAVPTTDFANARNKAAQLATTDVVFFLDSDEEVDSGAEIKIARMLHNQKWSALTIRRQDFFLGKQLHWGEVGRVNIPRIFRKGTFHYVREVHEQPVVTGSLISSGIIIRHYAHDSISTFFDKIIHYIQLEVELRQKDKQRVNFLTLVTWPTGKFFYNYICRLGFLDGWRGLIYATLMSCHSFGIRAMLYENQPA